MIEIIRPLEDAGCASFEVDGMEKNVWNSFTNVKSSSCEIHEENEILCVEQFITVRRLCVICLETMDDIHDVRGNHEP